MTSYVANVIPHLQAWWPVLFILAYFSGFIFFLVSCAQLISHEHRYQRTIAIWSFSRSILLLNIPPFLDALAMTIFNQSSEQSLQYTPPASFGSEYIQFAVFAIALVGLIGIIRGTFLLRSTAQQASHFYSGLVHMCGGILAVNLVTFLRGIGATIGGDVQTYITTIIG